MPGWYQELDGGEHVPETLEYGISSIVFRAKRLRVQGSGFKV